MGADGHTASFFPDARRAGRAARPRHAAGHLRGARRERRRAAADLAACRAAGRARALSAHRRRREARGAGDRRWPPRSPQFIRPCSAVLRRHRSQAAHRSSGRLEEGADSHDRYDATSNDITDRIRERSQADARALSCPHRRGRRQDRAPRRAVLRQPRPRLRRLRRPPTRQALAGERSRPISASSPPTTTCCRRTSPSRPFRD